MDHNQGFSYMKVEIPHWQRGDPMEGADLLTIRKLVTLSKQQFMDYDHERDPIEPNSCDSRCKGGLMDSAFKYTIMVSGLLFFFFLDQYLLKKLNKHKKDPQATPQKQDGLKAKGGLKQAPTRRQHGQVKLKNYIIKIPRPSQRTINKRITNTLKRVDFGSNPKYNLRKNAPEIPISPLKHSSISPALQSIHYSNHHNSKRKERKDLPMKREAIH